ncbi:hypothetical protein M0804_002226 [Polistes exclamans]|nr:hypothetical protein M0804_002226 [Polistes exclamans]
MDLTKWKLFELSTTITITITTTTTRIEFRPPRQGSRDKAFLFARRKSAYLSSSHRLIQLSRIDATFREFSY